MSKKILFLGIFSIIVAVVFVIFIIRSSNPVGKNTYIVYSRLDDASGLYPETYIRIAGVRIGKILKIELADNQAHLTLELDSAINIPNNSTLQKQPEGLLGAFSLIIELGTGDPLEENDYITYLDKEGILNTLDNSANKITDEFTKITQSIDTYISQSGILSGISTVVEELQDSLIYINSILNTLEQNADVNATSLNTMLPAFANIALSLEDALLGENAILGEDGGKGGLAGFQDSLQQLNEIVAKLNTSEGSIGKLINDDSIYNSIESSVQELNSTIENVNTVVGAVTDLETSFDYRIEAFITEDPLFTSKQHVNIKLKIPRSSREYKLGVTHGGGERLVTNQTYPDIDSTGLKLNLTIGQNLFSDYLTLHGGVIENTGGFRIDFNPFKEWTISSEVYNFDAQNRFGPNLRAFTRVEPFLFLENTNNPLKWLYFNAGVDDILNNYKRAYFVGLGLQIKDNFFYDAIAVLPIAGAVQGISK